MRINEVLKRNGGKVGADLIKLSNNAQPGVQDHKPHLDTATPTSSNIVEEFP